MCSDELVGAKFKRVCVYFLILALLTKSAIPGNIQVTYGHMSVGKNALEETINNFALTGSLESLTFVSIDSKRAFAISGKNIRLPVKVVLLRASVGNLVRSRNLMY